MRKILIFLLLLAATSLFANNVEVFFTKKDNVSGELLQKIKDSKKSIHAALYDVNYQPIANALISKFKSGVDVKVVSYYKNKDKKALQSLIAAGIPVVLSDSSGYMHNKFFIIDQLNVWSGSTNTTQNCLFTNRNNSFFIQSTDMANQFEKEFQLMFDLKDFNHSKKGPKAEYYTKVDDVDINYYFSPKNNIDIIIDKINNAGLSVKASKGKKR